MLDIKWIRENPEALAEALVKRQWSADEARKAVDGLIEADELRRAHLGRLQERQERRNAASKEIGNAMRAGDSARAEELKVEVAGIKEFIQSGEATERELDKALDDALAVIPNLPLDEVVPELLAVPLLPPLELDEEVDSSSLQAPMTTVAETMAPAMNVTDPLRVNFMRRHLSERAWACTLHPLHPGASVTGKRSCTSS